MKTNVITKLTALLARLSAALKVLVLFGGYALCGLQVFGAGEWSNTSSWGWYWYTRSGDANTTIDATTGDIANQTAYGICVDDTSIETITICELKVKSGDVVSIKPSSWNPSWHFSDLTLAKVSVGSSGAMELVVDSGDKVTINELDGSFKSLSNAGTLTLNMDSTTISSDITNTGTLSLKGAVTLSNITTKSIPSETPTENGITSSSVAYTIPGTVTVASGTGWTLNGTSASYSSTDQTVSYADSSSKIYNIVSGTVDLPTVAAESIQSIYIGPNGTLEITDSSTTKITTPISGTGKIRIKLGSADEVTDLISGTDALSGFNGTLEIATGRYKASTTLPSNVSISVKNGGQFYAYNNTTWENAFTIAGDGWAGPDNNAIDHAALRLDSATVSGPITIKDEDGIGMIDSANLNSGTVSGTISASCGMRKTAMGTLNIRGTTDLGTGKFVVSSGSVNLGASDKGTPPNVSMGGLELASGNSLGMQYLTASLGDVTLNGNAVTIFDQNNTGDTIAINNLTVNSASSIAMTWKGTMTIANLVSTGNLTVSDSSETFNVTISSLKNYTGTYTRNDTKGTTRLGGAELADGETATIAAPVTLSDGFTKSGTGTLVLSGTVTDGTVTMSGGTIKSVTELTVTPASGCIIKTGTEDIGGTTYNTYKALTAFTATVSQDTNWSDITWSGTVSDAANSEMQLTVQNNAVITLDNTVTYGSLVINGNATLKPNLTTADYGAAILGRTTTKTCTPIATVVTPGTGTTISYTADLNPGYELISYAADGSSVSFKSANSLRMKSININYYRTANTAQLMSNTANVTTKHGAYPVVGSGWTDVQAANNETGAALKVLNPDGSVNSDASSVTVSLYNCSAYDMQGHSIPDNILNGYIDDPSSPIEIIKGIPFTKYRLVMYFACDTESGVNFGYANVFDGSWNAGDPSTSYCGPSTGTTGGITIKGSSNWGYNVNVPALTEGVNYIVSDVMTNTNCKVQYFKGGRSGMPALQIIDCSGEDRATEYTAEVTEDTTFPSAAYINSAYSTITLTNTAASATYTFGANVTAKSLKVVSATDKALTLATANSATLTIPAYDFSEAVGTTSVGFGTGTAAVTAGTDTVLNGAVGTGTITIGTGKMLTVTQSGLNQSQVSNSGTLKISGGTSTDPIQINDNGDKNSGFGTVTLAENAYVKDYATSGNKLYSISGAADGSSTLILSSGQDWGMKDGSAIRNVKVIIQNKNFWWERASAFDKTVDLDISGQTLHLGNPDSAFEIGSFAGSGSISKDNTSDTLTINMDRQTSEYSGSCSVPFVVKGSYALTLSGSYTGALTVESGATVKLSGSNAKPPSLIGAGSIETTGSATVTIPAALTSDFTGNITISAPTSLGTINGWTGNLTIGDYATTIAKLADYSGTMTIADADKVTITEAKPNTGTIIFNKGTLTMGAGDEGTVVVNGGELRLVVSDQQIAAGYTASGVTISGSGSGTVYFYKATTNESGETVLTKVSETSGTTLAGSGNVWTNKNANGLFTDAGNWSTGSLPAEADYVSVSISEDTTITCGEAITVAGLTVKGTGTATFNGGNLLTASGLLQVETDVAATSSAFYPNTVDIPSGKTFTYTADTDRKLMGITGKGTFVKQGDSKVTLERESTSSMIVDGATITINAGKVVLSNTGDEGNANVGKATININADGELDNYGYINLTDDLILNVPEGSTKSFLTNSGSSYVPTLQGAGGKLIKTGAGTLNVFGNITCSGGVEVQEGTYNVSGDVSITTAMAITAGTLSVAEGKIFTSKGSTITFTDGTLGGKGTLKITDYPSDDLITHLHTSTDWTGTLFCYGFDINVARDTDGPELCNWCTANSKIKFTGCYGWLGGGTVQGEVILEDNGTTAALTIDDGSSGTQWIYGFMKVSGSGTLKTTKDTGNNRHRPIRIEDVSEFTGSISVYNEPVVVGTGATDTSVFANDDTTVSSYYNKIVLLDNSSAAVAAAKSWTATSGIVVNGTLTVAADSTISAVSGTGTIIMPGQTEGNALPTVASSAVQTSLKATDWTGTVWMKNSSSVALCDLPGLLANSGSKLKLSGIKGWVGTGNSNNGWSTGCEIILEDVDSTAALCLSTSASGRPVPIAKLSGAGTYENSASGGMLTTISDATDFVGAITLSSTDKILIGTTGTPNAGTIMIGSGASATVAADKTWAAKNGIVVDGTLTVEKGASVSALSTSLSGKELGVTVNDDGDCVYAPIDSGTTTDPIKPAEDGGQIVIPVVPSAGVTVQPGVNLVVPKDTDASKISVKYVNPTTSEATDLGKYVSPSVNTDTGVVILNVTDAAKPKATQMALPSDGDVQITVEQIPGLFYSVEAATSLDGFKGTAFSQATIGGETTHKFELPGTGENVKYYKVQVKATK